MQIIKKHGFIPRFILFALLLFMACHMSTVPAQAEVNIKNPNPVIYLTGDWPRSGLDYLYDADEDGIVYFSSYGRDTCPIKFTEGDYIVESSVRVDCEQVTAGKDSYYYEGEFDPVTGKFGCKFGFDIRFPGTIHVLFEDQRGREYAVIAKVLPYENPIKSLTVTNIKKGKNLAGMLDRNGVYDSGKGYWGGLFFSKKTKVPKLKVKTKKNWEIVSMWVYHYGYKYLNKIHAQSKTVELKRADKGDEVHIHMQLKNIKNGAYTYIEYGTDVW